MSWSSRFGQWSGRFSPFGRNTSPSSTQVTDSDFSYITSDDLARHAVHNSSQQVPASPGGNEDTVVLRNRKVSHPLHFPTGSLSSGEITIGVLRIAAAQKLDIRDARRIKLIYKGKNLKDDKALARDEGLHSGHVAEILVNVSEGADIAEPDLTSDAPGLSGESEDDDSGDDSAAPRSSNPNKRKKKRGSRKRRGGAKSPQQPVSTSASGTNTPRAGEYLPIPSAAAPRPSSAPPVSQNQASHNSPMSQLDALENHFQSQLQPQCEEFISNPPAGDKAKWEMKQKGLAETIMIQVMLKLDAVETDGNQDVRMRRKELVKEIQSWLDRLDKVVAANK